jgi:hypothetical protein
MLAFKLQTPGNNPEESIRHSKQGKSLKSRTEVLFVSSNLHGIFVRIESRFIGFKPFVKGSKATIQYVLEVVKLKY